MSLFTQSSLPWVSAVEQIADSAGASADTEMKTRAHRSLRAAFQYLNSGRFPWDFLRGEAVPTAVAAPFTVSTTVSAGQATATVAASHGIQPDDMVVCSGLLLGTRVAATATLSLTFSTTATGNFAGAANATYTRDSYSLPSDFRVPYSVRLLSNQRALRYVGRRFYDRLVTSETTVMTPPQGYDLFLVGSRSKIRLVPPPGGNDVLQLRYFRRMYLGSASGDTTALDIPEDFEQTPIAWAKWHFLTDKADARQGQGQVWFSLAKEGIQTMVAAQQNLPDDDLKFIPGAAATDYPGSDKSTRGLFDDY